MSPWVTAYRLFFQLRSKECRRLHYAKAGEDQFLRRHMLLPCGGRVNKVSDLTLLRIHCRCESIAVQNQQVNI